MNVRGHQLVVVHMRAHTHTHTHTRTHTHTCTHTHTHTHTCTHIHTRKIQNNNNKTPQTLTHPEGQGTCDNDRCLVCQAGP